MLTGSLQQDDYLLFLLCISKANPEQSPQVSVTTQATWFSEDSCSGNSEKDIYKLYFPKLRFGKTRKPFGKWQLKHLNVQNIFEYH